MNKDAAPTFSADDVAKIMKSCKTQFKMSYKSYKYQLTDNEILF